MPTKKGSKKTTHREVITNDDATREQWTKDMHLLATTTPEEARDLTESVVMHFADD
jgi:hypothetical protein